MTDITTLVIPEFVGAGGAFTNGQYNTLNASVTALTTSVNNLALSDYNGVIVAGVTAYPTGTAYASMTNSAAGINTAAANALAAGKRLVLVGTFRVESTVTIACDANLSLATFVCNSTTIAPVIRVGTTVDAAVVYRIDVKLPEVINEAQVVGSGWTGTSVGVEISNLNTGNVTIRHIRGFNTGFSVSSYGTGTAFNTVNVGHLSNNKRNMRIGPGTTGYTNENTFIGGRYAHFTDEGTNVSGCYQIILLHTSGQVRPDNNRFLGASLEGDTPQYHVSCDGMANLWLWCRWEASLGPKVNWGEIDASDYSRDNKIIGGIHSADIVATTSANSRRNTIDDEFNKVIGGVANNYIPTLIDQPNSDTASTTSTTTYQVCITDTITLPLGTTWTIRALASGLFSHSASGSIDLKMTIDGTDETVLTQQVQSAAPGTRLFRRGSKAGVVSGARVVTLSYRCNTAGTTAADNPSLTIVAARDA